MMPEIKPLPNIVDTILLLKFMSYLMHADQLSLGAR
jgi:hypothetical protein